MIDLHEFGIVLMTIGVIGFLATTGCVGIVSMLAARKQAKEGRLSFQCHACGNTHHEEAIRHAPVLETRTVTAELHDVFVKYGQSVRVLYLAKHSAEAPLSFITECPTCKTMHYWTRIVPKPLLASAIIVRNRNGMD